MIKLNNNLMKFIKIINKLKNYFKIIQNYCQNIMVKIILQIYKFCKMILLIY